MKNFFLVLFIVFFSSFFLFLVPSKAEAAILDDLVNGVKNFLVPGSAPVKELTLTTNIALAPGGDENKNGSIDAGDIIRFSYTIENTTDKKYAYATLKTNIKRDTINFIHNVSGVTGMTDDGKTIVFPNIRIPAEMTRVISFDARINYFTQQDPLITTEPELLTEDKKSLLKSGKKEVKVKRIKKEDIPSGIQMFRKE